MIVASFLFFTGLVAVITFILTRKDDHESSEGYFLAGRRLGGVVIAGSLLLTNLSTEQMVGLNGAAFKDGILVTCSCSQHISEADLLDVLAAASLDTGRRLVDISYAATPELFAAGLPAFEGLLATLSVF